MAMSSKSLTVEIEELVPGLHTFKDFWVQLLMQLHLTKGRDSETYSYRWS
jgi:hypothetical protein